MEKDKQRNQKTRRRERAQRMQAEKRQTQQQHNSKSKDCDSAEDELPLKEKPKRPPPPNRRKKAGGGSQSGRSANGIASANSAVKESLYEEDIIDGFAIFSFTNYDDLEVSRVGILLGRLFLGGLSDYLWKGDRS